MVINKHLLYFHLKSNLFHINSCVKETLISTWQVSIIAVRSMLNHSPPPSDSRSMRPLWRSKIRIWLVSSILNSQKQTIKSHRWIEIWRVVQKVPVIKTSIFCNNLDRAQTLAKVTTPIIQLEQAMQINWLNFRSRKKH